MSVFVRRFLTDPGDDVLLEIESVDILDLEPPASISGVGSGAALIFGEFENGPYNVGTEVTSADDLAQTFGGFGYTYAGVGGQYPSAVSRKSDSAINPEYWNGNASVQLSGKKFKRLIVVRVDTSIGSISISRLAFVTGKAAFAYNLEPGQIVAFDIGAGQVNTTFTAVAAIVTGSGGTFPTTFAGGETLVLGFDDATANPNFTVTFLAADQTNAQVRDRINAYAGFAFCDLNAGQLRFTSRQRGSGAHVRIVSGSTGVLAQLGLTAATTNGTGNVADIDSVKFSEIKAAVEAALTTANAKVEQDSAGRIRVSNLQLPLTGTIAVGSNTTATDLGFVVGATGSAASGLAGVIPAGTVVRNSGSSVILVTTQDVVITATSAGPFTAKVRHAVDDGTGLSANAGTIVVFGTVPDVGSFSVTNLALLPAALTESAIDVAYQAAMDATLDPSNVSAQANLAWSARQSNSTRRGGKQNALDASANGLLGRMFFGRTPMGTPKAQIVSTVSEPGVGAYRDQRYVHCAPNVSTKVNGIAKRGTAGGAGFTADGVVDVGWDGFVVSICSQLAPEEDPGQSTNFTTLVLGLESYWTGKVLAIGDYKVFKAAGVAAPRMDGGQCVLQSGVTSVDPLVNAALVNINRRRMADYIEDTLAIAAKKYGKKLSTNARRRAILGETKAFIEGLLSRTQPSRQRIVGYSLDTKGNTAVTLAKGLYFINLTVKVIPSLKAIVFAITVGESVDVEEVLPQAA